MRRAGLKRCIVNSLPIENPINLLAYNPWIPQSELETICIYAHLKEVSSAFCRLCYAICWNLDKIQNDERDKVDMLTFQIINERLYELQFRKLIEK